LNICSELYVIIWPLIVVFLCFIGDEKEYLSANYVDRSEADGNETFDVLTLEFLNTLTTSGFHNHKIKLKTDAPIMLLRNIDRSEGLCKGTRLIVTRLTNHVIEAKVISGKNIGEILYIPKMEITVTQSPWPFKLSRRQLPIVVFLCYDNQQISRTITELCWIISSSECV